MKKSTGIVIAIIIIAIIALIVVYGNGGNMSNSSTTTTKASPFDTVITLIDNINSAEDYLKADEEYNKLTPSEQSKVTNYDELLSAKEKYKEDLFVIKMAKKGMEIMKKTEDDLMDRLKNPQSYQCNKLEGAIYYDSKLKEWYMVIYHDYSAQNTLGGYERTKNTDIRLCYDGENDWYYFDKHHWTMTGKEYDWENYHKIHGELMKENPNYPQMATFTLDGYTLK